MLLGGLPVFHNRPNGVNDQARWQIVRRSDFRLAGRFLMTLRPHDRRALDAQLHARKRVDGVVDAVMAGHPASQELGIRGVHDSICRQRGDVPAPHGEARVAHARGDEPSVGDAFLIDNRVQQFVLLGEELAAHVLGQACVAQRAEKVPRLAEGSGNGAGRELVAGVRALFLQLGDEETKIFFDGGHGGLLIVVCGNPIISCAKGADSPRPRRSKAFERAQLPCKVIDCI